MGQKTAAQINELGGDVIFLPLDVTNEQGWIDVIAAAVSKYGKL